MAKPLVVLLGVWMCVFMCVRVWSIFLCTNVHLCVPAWGTQRLLCYFFLYFSPFKCVCVRVHASMQQFILLSMDNPGERRSQSFTSYCQPCIVDNTYNPSSYSLHHEDCELMYRLVKELLQTVKKMKV